MPAQPPPQSGGIFKTIFSTIKNFVSFILNNKRKAITYFVIIVLGLNLLKSLSDPATPEEKYGKIVAPIVSVVIADVYIYQETDKVFSTENSIFQKYYDALGFKAKILALLGIIKSLFTLFSYVIILIWFFVVVHFLIEYLVGEYNIPTPNLIILMILIILPTLIAANTILVDETTTPENFTSYISRYIPLRGIIHLGFILYEIAFDPAYQLVTEKLPKIEDYYNETEVFT